MPAAPDRPRVVAWFAELIDLRMAFAGSAVMGTLVWAINAGDDATLALVAAAKQVGYTFFFAGFVMRLCERLARQLEPRSRALWLGFLVPSLLAVGLTYGVHSLRGTPRPLLSTLPTLLLGPPSFLIWSRRHRARREAELDPSS